jgi:hypothetical protein
LVTNTQRRGFSVELVEEEEMPRGFSLIHRAVDSKERLDERYPVPIALLTEARIAFCPFCGRDLMTWYQATWAGLSAEEVAGLEWRPRRRSKFWRMLERCSLRPRTGDGGLLGPRPAGRAHLDARRHGFVKLRRLLL